MNGEMSKEKAAERTRRLRDVFAISSVLWDVIFVAKARP
jgi:hypothetical protein